MFQCLRGGLRSDKLETWFRDNMWPKRFIQWVNFLVGFCGPRLIWVPVGPRPYLGPKNRKWHKKFQPDWSKNGWVMAEKCMPLYGIIGTFRDFVAHKLAKYQYFQWNQLYSFSTINLHNLCTFQLNISLNVDFMAIKPQKVHKIGHISVCNFYPIVATKKVHTLNFSIFLLEILNMAS